MAKDKNPVTYTAPEDVQVDGKYYKAGNPFTTTTEPNDNWVKVKPADAHVMEASLDKVPGDAPIENLGVVELRAVAATKNINTEGMGKKELIAAIHAANEPRL